MAEMMETVKSDDSLSATEMDTLINFAAFLDDKKDSIASLSKAEQEKLEALRPLEFAMKMSDTEKKMDMRLTYAFKKLDDIAKFADAVEKADIKELKKGLDPIGGMKPTGNTENDSVSDDGIEDLFKMAESFDTKFSKKGFSRKMTEKAVAEMLKKKDTTMKADDPFADMIRFKQVYKFPYRVRSVNNPNAKVLSDFMGVELEASMFEMNNDPNYFNIEVEFEK